MTKAENNDLLVELLNKTGTPRFDTPVSYGSEFSSQDERQLLHAANLVGTPSLKSDDHASAPEDTSSTDQNSFAHELVEVIRRYPLPAVLVAAGVAFVVTPSKRRHARAQH